jgi:hypothetical protein
MKATKPKATTTKLTAKAPVRYSEAVCDLICTQIAQGISLNKICKQPDMPSIVAVYKWLDAYPEFVKKYARAKDDSADTIADQILDISDDDALDPNDKRVRIDARKWIASKLKPKKYGDKLELGSDGSPIVHTVTFEVVRAKNPDG